MTSVPQSYVPCLRWKQGEYQAVVRSTDEVLDFIVPLIEVADLGYDFEKRAAPRSIDEHLAPVAKRIHDKLGRRRCFLDMKHIAPRERMKDGRHPATHVLDGLRDAAVPAIPTFGLRQEAALFDALRAAARKDGHGVCLRIRLEEVADGQFVQRLKELRSRLGNSTPECDFILDLEAPNFIPVDGFVRLLETLVARLPDLAEWRTLTMMGTSFPATAAEVPRDISAVSRQEWIVYKRLVERLGERGLRPPSFGDYGIAHPALLLQDPRIVKPNATVRYTIDDAWLIAKGKNVRDYKFDQFRDLCRLVVASGRFENAAYSLGDKYIEDCASGSGSTGNLTTWRWVGTNHHLARVVRDISSLSGTSSSP